MRNQCTACNVEITAEDIVVSCEGFCEQFRYFHAKCVGLSYDEGCACLHENIFWMCDTCKDVIAKGRCREAMKEVNNFAMITELNSIKSELNRISQTVLKIEGNFTDPNESSKLQCSQELTGNTSPLSSTKLDAIVENHSPSTDDNLQLYVTNIANDVSDDEVKDMVCESIGAREVLGIKRLVAYGTNIATLDYVSYKVTVDAQFRSTATKSSSWPDGVRCREFRSYTRRAWRPSTAQQ